MSEPSPLAEAAPESLDELFSRDPLKLQTQDLQKIIDVLRAARERWRGLEMTGATRVPKAKAPPKTVLDPAATLKDLGL